MNNVWLNRKKSSDLDDCIKVAEKFSETILAYWYCKLNTWSWPSQLPHEQPPVYVANGLRSQVMQWIENRVGKKTVSRAWNCDGPLWSKHTSKPNMTPEQFENWWKAQYEDDRSVS